MSGDKFYTLTNDIIFKLIFGHPQRSRLLICLINALLRLEDEKAITEVQVLNPFNDKDFIGDKQSVLDIKARDGSGLLYNIEMQVSVPEHWTKRILYYAARLYTSQIKESDPYDNLQKTISISILNDVFFPGYESLHNSYRFRNDKNFDALENLIELHFIELPKFKEDKPRALSSKFEKWLHTFRFGDLYREDNMIPKELQDEEGIKEAIEAMRYANTEEEIRERIEAREKFMRDVISREFSAMKKGEEKGLKKGEEKGLKKGLKKGEETGLKKGLLEIIKMVEEGDITVKRAEEKLRNFRSELPDDEFWQDIDQRLKKLN